MLTYESIKSNYEIIKEFSIKYRKELTVYQGCFVELFVEELNYSIYTRIMNEMSDDEFTGNMFTSLSNSDVCEHMNDVLKGDLEFYDYIKDLSESLGIFETYLSRLNED